MEWRERAACRGESLDVFFPPSERGNRTNWAPARRICASCPVKTECLAQCLADEQITPGRHGMFGGLTPDQRARGKKPDILSECVVCGDEFSRPCYSRAKTCSEACWTARRRETWNAGSRARREKVA